MFVDFVVELEKMLSVNTLGEWIAGVKEQQAVVELPRFTITASYPLIPAFHSLGMRDAFSTTAADFSGMSGARPLFIDAILHKAYVSVTEEGTEAAAATPKCARPGKEPKAPPVFRADHPFIFLIRDIKTGTILFMGRVVNPEM